MLVDEPDQRVVQCRARLHGLDVDRALHLSSQPVRSKCSRSAGLGDAHVIADRAIEHDPVGIDERLAFGAAVGPARNRLAQGVLGVVVNALEHVEQGVDAASGSSRRAGVLAEPRDAQLSADVAHDEIGGAAVCAQDALDVGAPFTAPYQPHRRIEDPFS